MEASRLERLSRKAELNKNTIEMRLLAADAHDAGLGVLEIADLLGVTHRTVYRWLKV
jgi:transposase